MRGAEQRLAPQFKTGTLPLQRMLLEQYAHEAKSAQHGEADPQWAAARARTVDWSLEASLGARGWIDLGPVRASLGLGALAGLRPSSASDGGQTVVSNQGLGGELTVGLSVWL